MHLLKTDEEAVLPENEVWQRLVEDEIRIIVADAASSGETLRVGGQVTRLAKTYGNGSLSKEKIASGLILAAVEARVPLEIDQTE